MSRCPPFGAARSLVRRRMILLCMCPVLRKGRWSDPRVGILNYSYCYQKRKLINTIDCVYIHRINYKLYKQ